MISYHWWVLWGEKDVCDEKDRRNEGSAFYESVCDRVRAEPVGGGGQALFPRPHALKAGVAGASSGRPCEHTGKSLYGIQYCSNSATLQYGPAAAGPLDPIIRIEILVDPIFGLIS